MLGEIEKRRDGNPFSFVVRFSRFEPVIKCMGSFMVPSLGGHCSLCGWCLHSRQT